MRSRSLNIREISEDLGVPVTTLRRWIRWLEIAPIRTGPRGVLYYAPEDVEFLEGLRTHLRAGNPLESFRRWFHLAPVGREGWRRPELVEEEPPDAHPPPPEGEFATLMAELSQCHERIGRLEALLVDTYALLLEVRANQKRCLPPESAGDFLGE